MLLCFVTGSPASVTWTKSCSFLSRSNMNAGPSWNKVQRSKNSSKKRQSKPRLPHVSPQPRSSLGAASRPAEDRLKGSISPGGDPERSPLGPRCRGASGTKLFLDFQAMKILKEDADEDSASDLSDSERIPIPPSPLTPPDLHLRAEEIDPVHFDLHPGQGHAEPEYCYPDFLPPPFNSWDLQDMAVLLNSEHRAEAVPRTGGFLGRYLDRLVQLEWLQVQTVQSEKGKGAKARPPMAPTASGALKSPGRSKLMASALSRPLQEGPLKSGPSRKKDFHCEGARPSWDMTEASSSPLDVLCGSRLCSQKQTLDTQTEEKKKKSHKSSRPQRWDLSCGDSGSPKVESSGNLRAPRPAVVILDSPDSYRAARAQGHANLKKKGNVGNCVRASLSSEKKLKTNGVKQNTYKFKS